MKFKKINWFWLILGLLGILDTIVFTMRVNMNEGIVLPMILGLPLFVYGLFYGRLKTWMQEGFGRFLKLFFVIGYTVFLAIFILCTVMMCCAAKIQPDKDADAVIILGAGIRGNRMTITVKSRTDAALEYLNENEKSVVVVSGGQGQGEKVTEASIMAQYLISNGIDSKRIIQEDKSSNTMENFVFSKKKLDGCFARPYRVVFVTSDFHIYRAGLTAQAVGLSAQGLSSPSPSYIIPNNYLRETVAIVKTWVLGVE